MSRKIWRSEREHRRTGHEHNQHLGMASFGDGNGTLRKVNNLYEIDQAMSWIHGKHEFKFGFNWMTTEFAFLTPPKPIGSFTFNGSYTGYGLSDFLYGKPISSQIDITKFFTLNRFRPVFYVQDNWRVTPRLTLNLGLRNEMVTPWKERHDRFGVFEPANGGSLVAVGTPGYPEKPLRTDNTGTSDPVWASPTA